MDARSQKSDVPQIHLEKLWSGRLQSAQNLTGQINQWGQSVHFGEKEAEPNSVAIASLSATAAACLSVDLPVCSVRWELKMFLSGWLAVAGLQSVWNVAVTVFSNEHPGKAAVKH